MQEIQGMVSLPVSQGNDDDNDDDDIGSSRLTDDVPDDWNWHATYFNERLECQRRSVEGTIHLGSLSLDSNRRKKYQRAINHLYRGGTISEQRAYFLTRCIQRQTPLYMPLSTPMVIRHAMSASSSTSPTAQMNANTISAFGADNTLPALLSAHASKWENVKSHGALLSQLRKANMTEEDASELGETLQKVASGYRDDLMG